MSESQLDAIDGIRTHFIRVAHKRLKGLLERVAVGKLTTQQAASVLVALTLRAAVGQVLPPNSEAVEDIIELGCLARPIPDEKLRRIERGLACEQLTELSWNERTGTYAGYNAHRTANEPPCAACQAAGNAYEVDRKRRRRAEAAAADEWPLT